MSKGEPAGHNGTYFAGTFVLFLVISFAGVTWIHQQPLQTWWPIIAGVLAAVVGLACRWLLDRRSGG
jgi:protein-S-isoprenylcysteine O-methyltransferase Ste14